MKGLALKTISRLRIGSGVQRIHIIAAGNKCVGSKDHHVSFIVDQRGYVFDAIPTRRVEFMNLDWQTKLLVDVIKKLFELREAVRGHGNDIAVVVCIAVGVKTDLTSNVVRIFVIQISGSWDSGGSHT